MRLLCSIDGCDEAVNSRGYCKQHYYRWKRYGDPLAPVLRRGPIGKNDLCRVQDCGKQVRSKDLCRLHYNRQVRGIALGAVVREINPDRGCKVPDCERPHVANGLCRPHYYSNWKYGSVERPGRRKGSIDRKGYRIFRINGREVKEHRFVMEQVIGRPLFAHERVHHINGVRTDNRPENLELWSVSQPSGQRVTDKIAWAVELLQLYAPELLADRPVQLRLIT